MFGKKIKISDLLYAKLEKAALQIKATSVEELAQQLLDTEVDRILRGAQQHDLSKDELEAIENQLKGLGYLE